MDYTFLTYNGLKAECAQLKAECAKLKPECAWYAEKYNSLLKFHTNIAATHGEEVNRLNAHIQQLTLNVKGVSNSNPLSVACKYSCI